MSERLQPSLRSRSEEVNKKMKKIGSSNWNLFSRNSGSQVNANDGKWHHICATWENTAGSWKLFKDGMAVASDKGLATGRL